MDQPEGKFDLIVIGGGPSGLMCAGRAAELGARVLLLEKNGVLGKKLALTGGGRCNLTNAIDETRELVARYGRGGKPLFAAFSRFGPAEARGFFAGLGLATKVEAEGRVFPASDDARDVVRALAAYAERGGVRIILNAPVTGLSRAGKGFAVNTAAGEYRADAVAAAAGGTAYPETGSTGDAFAWLAGLGHAIVPPDVSLVPLTVKEPWIAELAGLSFPSARLTVWTDGRRRERRSGKILFTHFGLSGPLILNLSKRIGEALAAGPVSVGLDLLPDLTAQGLDADLRRSISASPTRLVRNILADLLPEKIVVRLLAAAGTGPETTAHALTREARNRLVALAKDFRLNIAGLLGPEKAIVSSGGVDPAEVNLRTMGSKIVPGLYILGDALNFNRPSGGFSLQICWTSGYLAGSDIMARRRRES